MEEQVEVIENDFEKVAEGRKARWGAKAKVVGGKIESANKFEALDNDDEVDVMGVEDENVTEAIESVVDSGAGKCVWPKHKKAKGKMSPPRDDIRLAAANGTKIEAVGQQTVTFKNAKGKKCGMNFIVSDVRKPLAAVSAIVKAGGQSRRFR